MKIGLKIGPEIGSEIKIGPKIRPAPWAQPMGPGPMGPAHGAQAHGAGAGAMLLVKANSPRNLHPENGRVKGQIWIDFGKFSGNV